MKRLRDEEATTPLMRKAQLLIDAVDPVPESRERMLRIRRQLDQPRARFAAIRRLPALVLATIVVLFGASAFAAVRIWVERLALDQRAAPTAAPSRQQSAAAGSHRSHSATQDVAVPAAPVAAVTNDGAPAVPAPSSAALSAAQQPASASLPAHHTEPRVRAKPRRPVAAPSRLTHVGVDSELVHRALKALRRDGDPALAARLLLENRAQNPDGPLAEEALSLQIEAASALHDAKAREFAREYLAHYPHGRYLSVAQRALDSAGP